MSGADRWVIHRYDSVTSTMEAAAQLARFGAPDRTAVVSDEQTHGRGRSGRMWQAPPGSAVFCTIIVRPHITPHRLSTLPLITGVAVAEAIEQISGHPARLKWPNDVWIGTDPERCKVAGILVTSSLRDGVVERALVGIGINVSGASDDLPPRATSLRVATGVEISAGALFTSLLARFDRAYQEFLDAEGTPFLNGWRSRAALLGENVSIEDAGRIWSGTFTGIDDDGALLLRDSESHVRRIIAGDLTRGPRIVP